MSLRARPLAGWCCGVLMLSILSLVAAFVLTMARVRREFTRAATSQEQLAAVARIEAASWSADRSSLAPLLQRYRRSIDHEAAQLESAGERAGEAVEAARADRLIALASHPAGNGPALHRLVAAISDGERAEAAAVAGRMARMRRHTSILAAGLAAAALASAALGGIGLVAANRHLTREVAARTAALAATERSRRLFFAKISHELRTPVTVMRGEAEVALADPAAAMAPLRDALDRVVANSEYLEHRIDELLSLTRTEHGELPLRAVAIDLGTVIDRACHAAAGYARSLDVGFARSAPAAPMRIRADPRWLQQALVAVLDNAVKFSPFGGAVAITAAVAPAAVSITVRDQGPGIPPGETARIFEPYYQAEAGLERGGAGLGLALARWVIERHGGTIAATHDQRGGGIITIVLPAPA